MGGLQLPSQPLTELAYAGLGPRGERNRVCFSGGEVWVPVYLVRLKPPDRGVLPYEKVDDGLALLKQRAKSALALIHTARHLGALG